MRVINHVLARLHQDQRGSVLVIVLGFFLPVAIAAAAFVIDVGNGAEHRRHLQLQADAGALAAAQGFNKCFLNESEANGDIEDAAHEYAGETHNPQIGAEDPQSRVDVRVNATDYDAASFSDGDPCETGYVDVKLTEHDSPPIFAFVGDQDFFAHARVKILTLSSSGRMLPIAVEDPEPKKAAVHFVDESTGTVLASKPLIRNGTSNGTSIWDNSTDLAAVPITAEHVGVRIALSGGTSTTCGQPLVSCYDLSAPATGPTRGLVHIRGWSAAGTGGATTPIARSVSLLPGPLVGGCPDPYFVKASVACTVGLNATIDFGAANPVTTLGATVEARVAGQPYPMTFSGGTWNRTGISIAPGTGMQNVVLHWAVTKRADGSNCNQQQQCSGDITPQRTLSANPATAGPIAMAQVTEPGVTPAGQTSNTFQRCSTQPLVTNCTHSLQVKIGLTGGLALSTTGGPPVHLRVSVESGANKLSLDCDPDLANLRDELVNSCEPFYRAHKDSDPACPASASELTARPNPPAWDCVAIQNGNATNQIAQGLNQRILGSQSPGSCTSPNHWPNWADHPDDPRIIFVLITPFGALGGTGSTTVPVGGFATFYVTGWTGQGGNDNPCLGHGDETPDDAGEIVGRYIQAVQIPNDGGGGEETCDFEAIDPCVAVLVE